MKLDLDFINTSVEMLKVVADYYELTGDPRRYGYYRAIESLRTLQKPEVTEVEKFTDLYGIGESIGSKLQYLYDSHNFPDQIHTMSEKLIEEKHSLNPHKHYMTRLEAARIVKPLQEFITDKLHHQAIIAGSYRRGNSVVGDIDLLVPNNDDITASDEIVEFCMDNGIEVTAKGSKKLKLVFKNENKDILECDVRFFDTKELGTMLLYFTGPAAFNIRLRQVAKSKNLKLSEYGITDLRTGEFTTYCTEESALQALGVNYVAPENR